ncbi:MAG: hypothetical protein HYT22_01355 [Candidatus Niyogibacteria bacterium]|nr:hypothetical protein [Candidatus Niyogibacteria bacterium]
MDINEKIAPIYSELQGYLAQAPEKDKEIFVEAVWERYNQTVEELNNVSGKNYDGYRVQPRRWANTTNPCVATLDYRTKLGGIIARLHREYFSDEAAPFSGMPNTVINQSQHQYQSIQMLLEIQDKISEKFYQATEGSKEKTFLEKVKSSLSSVRNATELLSLIMKTAKDIGLSVDELIKLFM